MGFSYPEGNFGGSQQLDSSISLSPLYLHFENDLHVSISCELPTEFLLPSFYAGIARCLSGRITYALTETSV